MPATPARPTPKARAGAAQAIRAISRLVAVGQGRADLPQVRSSLVAESRALLGARWVALLALKDGGKRAIAVGGDARGGLPIAQHPLFTRLLGQSARVLHVPDAADAIALLDAMIGDGEAAGSALMVRMPLMSEEHVLVLADPHPDAFEPEAIDIVEALVDAGVQALARGRAAEVDARRAARQSALTRAAKTLHASLDLGTVLGRICEEATRILDGDLALVYRGTQKGLELEAGFGVAPELIGLKLSPGQGLAGKVLKDGRPMLTNDYARISGLPPNGPFSRVRSCIAVPMRWEGDLRGVITVGYVRPVEVTEEQLSVLETFAELAAVAYTNASTHAGLAVTARTDGLTGCLNHAALHESLQGEIERAERSDDRAMSLIMIDLDRFKSINERHGHLVGDEVLSRAGHALREVTRPYDLAARYGGDEFAILSVETDEEDALEVARRAIERVGRAINELISDDACRATAGVAEWTPGLTPTELIARADRALLYGKHEGGRGSAVPSSIVPAWFRPGRFTSGIEFQPGAAEEAPAPEAVSPPDCGAQPGG